MSIFHKECGMFAIEVSPPSPMWVRIYLNGEEVGGHIQPTDLHDLRYLIDRAIEGVEAEEKRLTRLRSR